MPKCFIELTPAFLDLKLDTFSYLKGEVGFRMLRVGVVNATTDRGMDCGE
jgi:hypothetical protein